MMWVCMITTDVLMVSFLIIMPLSTLKLRSGYWQGQNGSCCIKHLKSKELELFARYWFWQYTKNCFCCKTLIDTRKSITMVPKKWLLTLHTKLMHRPLSLESLSGLYGVLYLFIFRCSGWECLDESLHSHEPSHFVQICRRVFNHESNRYSEWHITLTIWTDGSEILHFIKML